MIKITAFIAIMAFRILYQPTEAQSTMAPFANPSELNTPAISLSPAKLLSFNASIKGEKVILNWVVEQNETAYQFEVEKSTDGKNFIMAALVFGTDEPNADKYQFYEKAGKQKTLYRIKIINKNREIEYSSVQEINPVI